MAKEPNHKPAGTIKPPSPSAPPPKKYRTIEVRIVKMAMTCGNCGKGVAWKAGDKVYKRNQATEAYYEEQIDLNLWCDCHR